MKQIFCLSSFSFGSTNLIFFLKSHTVYLSNLHKRMIKMRIILWGFNIWKYDSFFSVCSSKVGKDLMSYKQRRRFTGDTNGSIMLILSEEFC